MGQTGRRGVLILVQGVQQVGVGLVQLLGGRNGLQPDGIAGITGLDQGQIVGGNGHAQGAQAGLDALFLFGGELHVLLQVLQGLDTVFDLPVPVVPLFIRNVGEQDMATGFDHNKSTAFYIILMDRGRVPGALQRFRRFAAGGGSRPLRRIWPGNRSAASRSHAVRSG